MRGPRRPRSSPAMRWVPTSPWPVDDAPFVAGFAHALEHTGGYTPDEATRVAKTLLPDMISYDPKRPCVGPPHKVRAPEPVTV